MSNFIDDIFEWDVLTWSKAYNEWQQIIELNKFKLGLELGSRSGGGSLLLAQNGIHTICSDVFNPIDKAEKVHKKYKLQKLISYESIDARNIKYPDNHFDIIIMKSTLGFFKSKDDRFKVIKEIHRVLKPGGAFLFAENMNGSFFHQIFRKAYVKWGSKWNYFRVEELNQLFNIFNIKKISYVGFLTSFALRFNFLYKFFYNLDGLFIFLPKRFKYVSYGYLIK